MVAHRRAALSCSRRSPRGRTSDLGAPREPRAYRCTGSAADERGQRHALSFCLSSYCTRLEPPARALAFGSVDPVCPGLTAPGALPLAQRLRLPPGPTTVVAPTPKPYVACLGWCLHIHADAILDLRRSTRHVDLQSTVVARDKHSHTRCMRASFVEPYGRASSLPA